MSGNPWRIALPSVLVGILLGGAGGAALQRHMFLRGPSVERVLSKLTGKLSLDAGQQTAVRAVLEERKAKMEALHHDTMAKVRDLKVSTRESIKKVLKPEQLKTYEAMLARADKWRKDEPPPPPNPGP